MSPFSATAAAPVLPDAELHADPHSERLERRLPSGRSLVLRLGDPGDPERAGEEIEIRSARGDLELRITLTDAGPVVSLRAARLEVESPDVAFRCRTFDVQTTGTLSLASEAEVRVAADEVRVETAHDIHLNGAFIRLNCTADGEPPPEDMVAVAAAAAAAYVAHDHDHDHPHHEP